MKNENPLVSIVTPSYNQGRFIEDNIISIINQDFSNIEHIVIDGGSNDKTLNILKKYENKYNLKWISEPDEGQSDAINKGFKLTQGEIVGWINSDDGYLYKNTLSYIVNKFYENPDIDIIYGDCLNITENNKIIRVIKSYPFFSFETLKRKDIINQPSTFFRKKVIKSHTLDKGIHLPMDYEYWMRLAKNGFKFLYVENILSYDRWHKDIKRLSQLDEMIKETRKVQEEYNQKFGLKNSIMKFIDNSNYLFLRIYSARQLSKVYSKDMKKMLAIPIIKDNFLKALLKQFFLYDGIFQKIK
jgi:glycosyltransferase involved in cell wall biosynthesis